MNKIDLTRRHLQGEWMDEPDLARPLHAAALRGLARINTLSRTAAALAGPIIDFAQSTGKKELRILDLATGGGDVPRALARRLRAAGLKVEVAACDRSAAAIDFARKATAEGGFAAKSQSMFNNSVAQTPPAVPLGPKTIANGAHASKPSVQFFVLDALREELPRDFDIITCSLFLHHLTDADTEALLRRMADAARRMVLISDLNRTRWGFALARIGTQLLSRSPVVHVDGPRSVEAAFTLPEISALAGRAGIEGAIIRRTWPARYIVQWMRDGSV